jgi:hypothetical protein
LLSTQFLRLGDRISEIGFQSKGERGVRAVAALEFRHHERIRLRLKARRLNEFAKCCRSVPPTPTAPAEQRQQRPSGREQHGGTRLGYYVKPCHEAEGICVSSRSVDTRQTENARNPVGRCKDSIKRARSASAEVAHIEQQIAQGQGRRKTGWSA